LIVGLGHAIVTIPERGEDEARRFYGEIIGLEEWDERIEGRKRFYTRDPFGNRLELLADVAG
jgi:hypothetical protein